VTDLPPNLARRVFTVLYPHQTLLKGDGFYATYHDGGLLIAESIGGLAQMISELACPVPEFAISHGITIALPRRQ
jgi:hypothetical protein